MNIETNKNYFCIVCNSANFLILLHLDSFPLYFGALPKNYHSTVSQYPLTIALCKECNLVQQTDRVEESIMNNVYEADYYNCPSPTGSGMGICEIQKFYHFFNSIKLNKGKLLEIGCFDGYLLNELQKEEWDVYGIDPSNATTNIVNNFPTGHIKSSFFDNKSFPNELFDVIIFRNLLEHIYNPNEFLRNVTNRLNENGYIFIDVPNIKALNAAGGIGSFFHQHISYFSIESMQFLLRQHGFNVIKYHEGSPNLFVCSKKERWMPKKINKENINDNLYDIADKIKAKMKKAISIFETNKNIVLFGASLICTTIINSLDKKDKEKIKYIFDNDKTKHGRYIFNCNITIQAPKKLNDNACDIIFILTWIFSDEILDQLLKIGYRREQVVCIADL